MDFKIDLYVSQTCGACRVMKTELGASDLIDKVTYKYIDDQVEGDRNIAFIRKMGYASVPAIHIQKGEKEFFQVGYMPLKKIKDKINEL